jgi:hypothetical protein
MSTEIKTYRVSLWDGRKPRGIPDSQYVTHDESLAWKSLYADMKEAGDGSWGKVEQLHEPYKCLYAEQANGKGTPKIRPPKL